MGGSELNYESWNTLRMESAQYFRLDFQSSWEAGFTANHGTEGANENFLFWYVFKELFVTQLVLHRFG